MPNRSIAGVAARLAARLGGLKSPSSSRRRPVRALPPEAFGRLIAKPAIASLNAPVDPEDINDGLFWDSVRALMVIRLGRGTKDWHAVSDQIRFCRERQENKRLSAADREAWRTLAARWASLAPRLEINHATGRDN